MALSLTLASTQYTPNSTTVNNRYPCMRVQMVSCSGPGYWGCGRWDRSGMPYVMRVQRFLLMNMRERKVRMMTLGPIMRANTESVSGFSYTRSQSVAGPGCDCLIILLQHRHYGHYGKQLIAVSTVSGSRDNHILQQQTEPSCPPKANLPSPSTSIALSTPAPTPTLPTGCDFMISYTQTLPSTEPVQMCVSAGLNLHWMRQLPTLWLLYYMTLLPVLRQIRQMVLSRAEAMQALLLLATHIDCTAQPSQSLVNWPIRTSQKRMLPSIDPHTIQYPSTQTCDTESLNPLMMSMGEYELARLSQHRTVVSQEPDTMMLLSGLQASELMRPLCPVYLRMVLPSSTSVMIKFLSPPPVTNLELSLQMSSALTSQLCIFLQCLIIRFLEGLYKQTPLSSDPVMMYSLALLNLVTQMGPVWVLGSGMKLQLMGSLGLLCIGLSSLQIWDGQNWYITQSIFVDGARYERLLLAQTPVSQSGRLDGAADHRQKHIVQDCRLETVGESAWLETGPVFVHGQQFALGAVLAPETRLLTLKLPLVLGRWVLEGLGVWEQELALFFIFWLGVKFLLGGDDRKLLLSDRLLSSLLLKLLDNLVKVIFLRLIGFTLRYHLRHPQCLKLIEWVVVLCIMLPSLLELLLCGPEHIQLLVLFGSVQLGAFWFLLKHRLFLHCFQIWEFDALEKLMLQQPA